VLIRENSWLNKPKEGTMKLEGEFIFQGQREEVWELLQDPEILANSLPGTKKLEKTGEDEYKSEMFIRVGPVNGIFNNKVTLKDQDPHQRFTMIVDSKGGAGFAKGTAFIELIEQEPRITVMKYEAELQVGGRLASVGQRLLDTVGKSMTRQVLEAMNQALQSRITPESEDGEAYTVPSQTDFARTVAKDVLRETIRPRQVIWIAAAIVVVAVVVWMIFR
jgi:carbon monoxide dehydrogenase subunit G